ASRGSRARSGSILRAVNRVLIRHVLPADAMHSRVLKMRRSVNFVTCARPNRRRIENSRPDAQKNFSLARRRSMAGTRKAGAHRSARSSRRTRIMDYRLLGGSGFMVPALSLGTGTFGGGNAFFNAWGGLGVAEATRLVDISLEAGLTMFDSADVYSGGLAEEVLGEAIAGRREQVIISTKSTFRS